jgi:hypothetical protein
MDRKFWIGEGVEIPGNIIGYLYCAFWAASLALGIYAIFFS